MQIALNILILCAVASAAGTSLLQEAVPTTAAKNEVFTFHPKEKHHFNLKAPQICGAEKAFDVQSTSLKCQFKKSGPQQVSFKICDDKETFCKSEDFKVAVAGNDETAAAEKKSQPRAAERPLPPGFTSDVAAAQQTAKKEHRLVLLDFHALWCPPCNVMEDGVFNNPAFLKSNRGFVLVSLDADDFTTGEWRSRFHVQGLPTLVVTDENMQEIGRRYEASLPVLSRWLKEQKALAKKPLAPFLARPVAELKTADKIRLAEWFLFQSKPDDSLKYLAGMQTRKAQFLQAQALVRKQSLDETISKADKIALYSKLVPQFDGHDGQAAEPAVIDWLGELAPLDPKNPLLETRNLNSILARLQKSKRTSEEGTTLAELKLEMGEGLEEAELKAPATAFYLQAADELTQQIGGLPAIEAKGLNQMRAKAFLHAGRAEEAEKIYATLANSAPKEFTFHYNYARALLTLQKYPQALEEVNKAEALAYGDNALYTKEVKAKILIAMGKKKEAHDFLEMTLKSIDLPEDSELWTHSQYKTLQALQKQTSEAL